MSRHCGISRSNVAGNDRVHTLHDLGHLNIAADGAPGTHPRSGNRVTAGVTLDPIVEEPSPFLRASYCFITYCRIKR